MYLFLPRKCHGSGFLIAGFYLKYSSFSPVIMYTNVLGVRNKVLDIFLMDIFLTKKKLFILVCPEWQFGKSCKPCSCNKTNSVSCDHITGQCTCRSGFSGATCDCLKGNNPCNETISECHLPTITSTPVCLCKTEYMRKNYNCNGN